MSVSNNFYINLRHYLIFIQEQKMRSQLLLLMIIFAFTNAAYVSAGPIEDYNTYLNDLRNYNVFGYKTTKTDSGVIDFFQGALQETGQNLDLAIEGEGFFQLLRPDGRFVYTRNGNFTIDSKLRLVHQYDGYTLVPEIIFTENYIINSINISNNGAVTCKIVGAKNRRLSPIHIYLFKDKSKLKRGDSHFFYHEGNSKNVIKYNASNVHKSRIHQKFLEMNNVSTLSTVLKMRSILYKLKNTEFKKKINLFDFKVKLLEELTQYLHDYNNSYKLLMRIDRLNNNIMKLQKSRPNKKFDGLYAEFYDDHWNNYLHLSGIRKVVPFLKLHDK